jgi:phospholipid transport system substrate-binding protein
MTYASRFVGVGEDTFRIGESTTAANGRAQVTASIARVGAPAVPLEYVLREGEGGWKIINIVADGVSDLALKRSEYQGILSTGSIDDLIVSVERQIERLE